MLIAFNMFIYILIAVVDMLSFDSIAFWKANFRIWDENQRIKLFDLKWACNIRNGRNAPIRYDHNNNHFYESWCFSTSFGFELEFRCSTETINHSIAYTHNTNKSFGRWISSFNFMPFHDIVLPDFMYSFAAATALCRFWSPQAACQCICLCSFVWVQFNNGLECIMTNAKTIEWK